MMSASEKYQAEKRKGRINKFELDDKDWIRDAFRLQPIVYQKSKKLQPACLKET